VEEADPLLAGVLDGVLDDEGVVVVVPDGTGAGVGVGAGVAAVTAE
jgi:hypothetical protein